MRKSAQYVLLALCFLAGLLAGWILRPVLSRHASHRASTPVVKPVFDWNMDGISVSPDGNLAVVRWEKIIPPANDRESPRSEYRVALYDLPGGRRISDVMPVSFYDIRPGYIAWSPSGKYIACHTLENDLLVFKRNGTHLVIDEKEDLYAFVWMPEKPDTLFMPLGAVNSERHLTYHAPTGKKTVATGDVYQSLFPVNGRTCGGKFSDAGNALIIEELLTHRVLFRIPLYEYERWDGPESLMVSPDGKYFQLAIWASGSAFNLVARTADAARVLRDKHLAIDWFETMSGGNTFQRILWPVATTGASSTDLLMQQHIFLGNGAINSRTGSNLWPYSQLTDMLRSIDYWYGRQDYLLVKPEGLFSASGLIEYTKEPAGPILPGTMTDEELLR
ncbi:MAG: hypothetical protein ACYDCO_23745 [Armatimonadota bacterium]